MASVSVVTVTWNSSDTIQECIGSVLEQREDLSIEMIVVDNTSTDLTCKRIEAFPGVVLIKNSVNVGFARACNQGISATTGEYLVLLNPDAKVTKGLFLKLITVMEGNPRLAAVGPRILTPDGRVQRECGRRHHGVGRHIACALGLHLMFPSLSPYLINGTETSPMRVEAVSGACMMVRRTWVEKHGGLDEQMFMYAEDADWCYRMDVSGFEVWYQPEAVLEHIGGASSRKAALPWARRVHYGGHLARHRYFCKMHGRLLGTLAFLVLFPLAEMSQLLRAVVRGLRGDSRWWYQFRKHADIRCWVKVGIKALTGDSYTW